jgi:hypothetical protein
MQIATLPPLLLRTAYAPMIAEGQIPDKLSASHSEEAILAPRK